MAGLRGEPSKADELYEFLALMTLGACCWYFAQIGGMSDRLEHLSVERHLFSFILLALCVGVGALVAMVRKSLQLRRAIHARIMAEQLAEATARHDALTGLANRRLFSEALQNMLNRGVADSFAVMLIDLDRFKPVNDIHGHAAGNAVLCTIADRLLEIAPPGATVARLGGDEFALLMPIGTSEITLASLAEQVTGAVRQPIEWNRSEVQVDATIGIAFTSPELRDADALLHAADIAMYQGKREGRGTYRFYHSDMERALRERAQMETELRAAIANDEIRPHFQPIVSLPGKELVGFEVLARWSHPRRGEVGPDEFIRIAEDTGMIGSLFYSVLRQACTDARNWPSDLILAVNVSPRQLPDPRLANAVHAILTQTRFPPGRLEIEVTESALINDVEAARFALASLQALGVRIALDDFGTGYSSLFHLREFKFNKLKIDRSYVTEAASGSEEARLVDAIIQLGSSLSLQTTAEGVENESSLGWLADQGCTFGQGYLFGRPLPREETEALIRNTWRTGRVEILVEPYLDTKIKRLRPRAH